MASSNTGQIINKRNHKLALTRILVLRAIALVVALIIIAIFELSLQRPLLNQIFIVTLFSSFVFIAATLIRLKRSSPVKVFELSLHLLADAALLTALVSLSGGATNPFIYYYLVLIAVSAAALPQLVAWVYCGIAVLVYSVLMYFDLGAHAHHGFSDFQLHLLGMWFNFVGSALLMCLFVSRFATALQNREIALAKIREENLRNEQLISVGTLATSTAHHLGTPLNSISILLTELDLDADKYKLQPDIDLALSQVDRAKQALSKLHKLAEPNLVAGENHTLSELEHILKEHFLLANPRVMPSVSFTKETAGATLNFDILFQHALINLIDNAIRAAHHKVQLSAEQKRDTIRLIIEDDGDGFSEEQLNSWGQALKKSEGLGIGIFLANHTIEKAGGQVYATHTEDDLTRVIVEMPSPAPIK